MYISEIAALLELRRDIRRGFREQCEKAVLDSTNKFGREQLALDSLSIGVHDYTIDGYQVSLKDRDQYNNTSWEFNKHIPLSYVGIFASIICNVIDDEHVAYRYRATSNFFIDYFRAFREQLCNDDVVELVKIYRKFPTEHNNRQRYGFEAWLLTDSYSRDTLNPWNLKHKFDKNYILGKLNE